MSLSVVVSLFYYFAFLLDENVLSANSEVHPRNSTTCESLLTLIEMPNSDIYSAKNVVMEFTSFLSDSDDSDPIECMTSEGIPVVVSANSKNLTSIVRQNVRGRFYGVLRYFETHHDPVIQVSGKEKIQDFLHAWVEHIEEKNGFENTPNLEVFRSINLNQSTYALSGRDYHYSRRVQDIMNALDDPSQGNRWVYYGNNSRAKNRLLLIDMLFGNQKHLEPVLLIWIRDFFVDKELYPNRSRRASP